MSIRATPEFRWAFTLLEVMIATMIVAMVALTCFRFLTTNLRAMRISSDLDSEREALQSVVRLLEYQLDHLPPRDPAALIGQSLKFQGLSNDEITWQCGAGHGVLTTAAPDEYRVTLTVQPVSDRSNETELGLRRHPIDPKSAGAGGLNRGGSNRKYSWVPLIRPMAAIEVRYFDARSNRWTDSWLDAGRRPSLVRVRLWKRAGDPAVEAVLPVPSSQLQS